MTRGRAEEDVSADLVSADRERKQNAVNFNGDFLLHAAQKILRFKRVGVVVNHKKGAQPTEGEKRA